MSKRFTIAVAAALLLLSLTFFFAYRIWSRGGNTSRTDLLAAIPGSASTIVFADLAELRQSPFAAKLYSWAPKPQIDADYAQFLRDTGFDYERDLDRVVVATIRRSNGTVFFAIGDGHFDRKKLVVYASQFGTHESRSGHEIFSVPVGASTPNENPRKVSFTFLRKDRVALVSGADLSALLSAPLSGQDAKDWRERFERLAGSPVFAVLRQDAAPGSALASRAPSGYQSPQLSSLLDQLQWITIAGKPEGDHLRVVTEGESATDSSAHQLADMLSGILLMAQAGLNGPQVRQQIDPQAREAYLEMLKSADVSRIDRGDTKSVRLVFDVSPNLLAATTGGSVSPALPVLPESSPAPAQKNTRPTKSSRRK